MSEKIFVFEAELLSPGIKEQIIELVSVSFDIEADAKNMVFFFSKKEEILSTLSLRPWNTSTPGRLLREDNKDNEVKEIWLVNFCTAPTQQGKGYGTKLLDYTLQWYRNSIYNDEQKYILLLEVLVDNPALELYKRFGFVIINEYEAKNKKRYYVMQYLLTF